MQFQSSYVIVLHDLFLFSFNLKNKFQILISGLLPFQNRTGFNEHLDASCGSDCYLAQVILWLPGVQEYLNVSRSRTRSDASKLLSFFRRFQPVPSGVMTPQEEKKCWWGKIVPNLSQQHFVRGRGESRQTKLTTQKLRENNTQKS